MSNKTASYYGDWQTKSLCQILLSKQQKAPLEPARHRLHDFHRPALAERFFRPRFSELAFIGENSNITLTMYVFDNLGKMTGAAVLFPASKMYTTMDFLAERYVPVGYSGGYGIYMSNDQKMGVGITVYDTSYLMIVYSPKSKSKSSNSSIENQIVDLVNAHFNKK